MNDLDDDLREGEPPPLPVEPRPYPIHPLFPLPEGVRETKEIHEISFDRWDHQGKKERCPDRFPASELTSLAQVIDMFGGGTYQFFSFDARGSFSRWTSDKDKVRVALPCKPFRQVEPEPEASPPRAAAHPQPPNDLVPLLIAAQERADRMLTSLLERIANAPAPLPPPAPPPAPDPMAMLTGLATVMEKLRPPQSGDMIGQLSGLVGIAKQLGKGQPSAADEDTALQPLLTMMTNAMTQSPAAPAPPVAASTPMSTPPGLVWVDVPRIGPVLMRPEQAANALAHLSAPAAPPPTVPAPPPAAVPAPATPPPPPVQASAAPGPASPAFASSWDDVAARLKSPAEQLALKAAVERVLAASVAQSPAAAPRTAEPPAPPPPSPRAPEAPVPSQTPQGAGAAAALAPQEEPHAPPAPVTCAPASPAPTPAPSHGPRCIVCGEAGTTDPAQPNVLVCRHNHRSLLSSPPADGDDGDDLVPLESLATEQIEGLIADDECRRTMTPEMLEHLQQELTTRKDNTRGAAPAA